MALSSPQCRLSVPEAQAVPAEVIPEARHGDAKRGALHGGAATEEAISSSRRVLTAARGNKDVFVGLQQFFTPPEAALLIAEVLGRRTPVLDPTAGSGSLLSGFEEGRRYGIEIDGDHAAHPDVRYAAIHGDAQQVVPMLRAAGARFPALAINPPFGLDWTDASKTSKSKANINSTVLAYLWSLDLMDTLGQGAMICGTDRLATAILSREEGRGIYAVADVEGPLFEGVSLPSSVAFYVRPDRLDAYRETDGQPGPARLRATREELPGLADEIREARKERCPYVANNHTAYARRDDLHEAFTTVGREYARRRKATEEKAAARRHDLSLRGAKVLVGLSAYSKLALANAQGSGAVRQVQLLGGQHVSYFGQNPRSLRQLRELRDGGIVTLSPALEEAADRALAEADRISTPLFNLKPQMRLGWLTDLDRITCKKSNPERGFTAGEEYALATDSKLDQQEEKRVVENRHGEPELRKFTTERKLLQITIGKRPEHHVFDEGPQNIAYLIDYFEVPDPGSVAERFPEEVGNYRRLLEEIAEENGFTLKEFQIDHLSRLLTKRRGVLAHEQGLGKTLQLMVLAEATVRLGAKNQVLFVAPQDLLRQWSKEYKRFFGVKVRTEEEVREGLMRRYKADAERYAGRELEEIRTPEKAREVAKRLEQGEEGWFITYYEALSIVGRKKEVRPEQLVDGRAALGHRLAEYKRGKRGSNSPVTLPETLSSASAATTKDACPSCGADTGSIPGEKAAWNGEVCSNCGYVHRSLYKKPAYSHLTTAFEDGVKCIDEIAEVRGDDSLRSKAIRGMARGPHFYGATGTPL